MSSILNKSKVRVMIALAMIFLVVVVAVTANFIKNNAVANKISENIEQGSAKSSVHTISGITLMKEEVKPKPIVKSKQIGYISKVYEEDGKRYSRFDDVKFLMGNEAIVAAKKSGDAQYENGEYFVYDDYYIVNSSEKTKNYVIDDKASLNLLGCWI
ncbi:MAG: hypothetical protein MUO60_14670, partial [Clostridiaceae bacterium]|nr:hypothetical protein [Clostridiaceae bacterium]